MLIGLLGAPGRMDLSGLRLWLKSIIALTGNCLGVSEISEGLPVTLQTVEMLAQPFPIPLLSRLEWRMEGGRVHRFTLLRL